MVRVLHCRHGLAHALGCAQHDRYVTIVPLETGLIEEVRMQRSAGFLAGADGQTLIPIKDAGCARRLMDLKIAVDRGNHVFTERIASVTRKRLRTCRDGAARVRLRRIDHWERKNVVAGESLGGNESRCDCDAVIRGGTLVAAVSRKPIRDEVQLVPSLA